MQETPIGFLGRDDPGKGIGYPLQYSQESLVAQLVKNSPAVQEKPGLDPWVGKIPWRREREPTPVFWPGEFQGLDSPWGPIEWDMKELLSLHFTSCRVHHVNTGLDEALTGNKIAERNINNLIYADAAAAKLLQSCPTLCDPTDGSPPGSPIPGKAKSESVAAQSFLTLKDPMDCSLPGSSVHGIFLARVLEWGAIAFFSICRLHHPYGRKQ